MALIHNLPIFVQNGGHFVCYHGDGVWDKKFNIIFLLSKTHSTVWEEQIELCKLKTNSIDLSCLTLTNHDRKT